MMKNFEIDSSQIDKIKKITAEEKKNRMKNLNLFNTRGFPNKKSEDWKFSDFSNIVYKNFERLDADNELNNLKKIDLLKDFEHNYIFVINGNLVESNFDHEDKSKIIINHFDKNTLNYTSTKNSLVCLNHALAENGYSLEIKKDYKFKKSLVIYNIFEKNVENKILNNKNKIKLNENSELHIIEYIINNSKFKFINNVHEDIVLEKNSKLKNIYLNSKNSNGYFYKFLKNKLNTKSNYSNFIFSSGLKFNKMEIECDLYGQNSECNVYSALFLNQDEHQEIKTFINHLVPNCKSFQKIKNILNSQSKGVFQGKIYVKDIAQKTSAYQLSKALLLDDESEFNSKPELEIYADDVKCSHGSTSGSIDENSLYYLMTRGLNRKEATKILIKGFLDDIAEVITNSTIKKFVQLKIEDQISGY